VTEFYGYKNLSRSVTPIPNLSGATQHRLGIVNGVGHVASRMYASPVGMSALLDKEVKAGPRPPPMPSSHKDGDGDKNVAGGRHKNGKLMKSKSRFLLFLLLMKRHFSIFRWKLWTKNSNQS